MAINISQLNKVMALRHVELVTGSKDTPIYIRFLHDAKEPSKYPAELKGRIEELWPAVEQLQAEGYGVFLVVNEGDADPPFESEGHVKKPMVKNRNIARIRAMFTDRDGPPKPGVKTHLTPSFITKRDENHVHAYWLVDDCPLSDFRSWQRRLANHYGTDSAVCNPARVMRLAGTLNCKPAKAGEPPRAPMLYNLAEPRAGSKRYKLPKITVGLDELPGPREASRNLGSDDPRKLHPETVEKMFAHFDPTLKGERGTWYGAIRLLSEHAIALTHEMPDDWWFNLAVSWSDGSLRRKHIDKDFPLPDTFKVRIHGGEDHDTEEEIGKIFDDPDETAYEGQKFATGSLIHHANAGGYTGSIDNRPMSERLSAQDNATAEDRELISGSDVEIARCVLADLRQAHGEIVHVEGAFYRYDDKRWVEIADDDLRLVTHHYDSRTYGANGAKVRLTQSRIGSILHETGVMCAKSDFFKEAAVGINAANGFVRFDTDGKPTLVPHSSEHRARHVMNAEWHADVDWTWEAPLLNALLDGCFNNDADKAGRIALISELCGCAALGNATKLAQPKAIVLHGPGANNGKSQILDLIRGNLPQDAISAVPPSKFDLDPMIMRLRGKYLNAVDELGTSHAITSEVFKGIITGEPRTARDLYKSAEDLRPVALHIFATNLLPPFQGGFDNGVRRRLTVLPMTRIIPEAERVPGIGARIVAQEGEALLAFAVEGASRLLRQGRFTEPPSSREALRQWVYGADPVQAWLAERTEFVAGHRTPQRVARDDFEMWACREGFDRANFPRANNFAQRVLASDGRLDHAQNGEMGRFFIGLRIRPDLSAGHVAGLRSPIADPV